MNNITQKEVEEKKKKEFRVISFAFIFKTSKFTLKASKDGVYTPKDEAQKAFLEHQVKQGNISFS